MKRTVRYRVFFDFWGGRNLYPEVGPLSDGSVSGFGRRSSEWSRIMTLTIGLHSVPESGSPVIPNKSPRWPVAVKRLGGSLKHVRRLSVALLSCSVSAQTIPDQSRCKGWVFFASSVGLRCRR